MLPGLNLGVCCPEASLSYLSKELFLWRAQQKATGFLQSKWVRKGTQDGSHSLLFVCLFAFCCHCLKVTFHHCFQNLVELPDARCLVKLEIQINYIFSISIFEILHGTCLYKNIVYLNILLGILIFACKVFQT